MLWIQRWFTYCIFSGYIAVFNFIFIELIIFSYLLISIAPQCSYIQIKLIYIWNGTLISIAPRCSVTKDPLMSSRIFVSMLMWIFSAVRGIHNRYSNSGDGHKIDSKESRSYLTFPGDGHHAGHIDSVTKKTILGHLTAHHLCDQIVVWIAIGNTRCFFLTGTPPKSTKKLI